MRISFDYETAAVVHDGVPNNEQTSLLSPRKQQITEAWNSPSHSRTATREDPFVCEPMDTYR